MIEIKSILILEKSHNFFPFGKLVFQNYESVSKVGFDCVGENIVATHYQYILRTK